MGSDFLIFLKGQVGGGLLLSFVFGSRWCVGVNKAGGNNP
jgi:hypothetical protein